MKRFIFGLLILLLFTACGESTINHEDDNSHHTSSNVDTSYGKTVIKQVYVKEEDFDLYDPYNGSITDSIATYWYVYYQVNTDYEGYKVVELPTKYFDVSIAIKRIKPDVVDADFVGIQYFKQVPFETYKSYMEKDGK